MNQVISFISKYKIWIIIIIILIVLIAAIYYVNKKEVVEEKFNVFPLQKGSSGEEVKKIQEYILLKGGSLPKYGADGIWGPETDIAIINTLKVNQISEDLYKSLIK